MPSLSGRNAHVNICNLMSDEHNHDRDFQRLLESAQFKPGRTRLRIPWVNIILFLLTVCSTMFFGAFMAQNTPELRDFWNALGNNPRLLLEGAPFSVTLMVILLSHELSHYFFSRYHRVPSSLPYFIPAPNLIGTFGAVILMRGRIRDRRALLDIGAAGPLAGFIVSLFALYVGVNTAQVVAFSETKGAVMFIPNWIIRAAFHIWLPSFELNQVIESPILDAAWVGFFVTMLNLLPIGQLDGGHIAYACLDRFTIYLSWAVVAALFLMGGLSLAAAQFGKVLFWEGWLFFAILSLLLMGPRGIRHPPPVHPEVRLGWVRWMVAIIALIVFLLTFTPTPFVVTGVVF